LRGPVTLDIGHHEYPRKDGVRFQLRSRTGRKKVQREDRQGTLKAVLVSKFGSVEHRLTAIEGHLREIALVTGAKKRSIVLRPYLQDDLEHDLVQRFFDNQPHKTPELALLIGKDRRQILRIIRRINRRVKRSEGVEPFAFDPSKRTWQLGLEIVDRKELQ